MNPEVENVLAALCQYGLRMRRSSLSEKEAFREKTIITDLLKDNDPDTLIDAIRFGMPNVWPYSEPNRIFSAANLQKNILEAKAQAGLARRAGEIPYRPR